MRRTTAGAVIAIAFLAACVGSPGSAPEASRTRSTSVTTTPEPTEAPSGGHPTHAIRLHHLPQQGLAIGLPHPRRVLLVSLRGARIIVLRRFAIENSSDPPGPVLLVKRHRRYALTFRTSTLHPLSDQQAELIRADHGAFRHDGPNLPTPPGQAIDESGGFWRWSATSRTGQILAQWTGECEIPTTYLIDGRGGAIVPITGVAAPSRIPESIGLGWTRGGLAMAVLPQGACASGVDLPGVYAFRAAGSGSLVVATPLEAVVRMWGPSAIRSRP